MIRQQSINRAPTVLFSSTGSLPLRAWDVNTPKTGGSECEFLSPRESGLQQKASPIKARVDKIFDEDLRCFCIDLAGSQTHISTPPAQQQASTPLKGRLPRQSLQISQPWVSVLVKNMGEPFHFELTIRDVQGVSRRVRFSTLQSRVKNSQFSFCLQIENFCPGWNCIQFDLSKITSDAFSQTLQELSAVNIHATCRLKCIICTDKSMTPSELYDALGQNHWPSTAVDMERLFLYTHCSPRSTSARQAKTHTMTSHTVLSSPLYSSSALFVIDKDPSTCRRVRSFSAIPSSTDWSQRSLSPPQRLVLSQSSLAALDLAEPLPSLFSSMRVSTPHDSDTEREDSTTDSLSLGTTRDFRPSLPPLPECEEAAQLDRLMIARDMTTRELPCTPHEEIVSLPTHIYSAAGHHFFTPVNQLTPVKLNDSPTTSSTSETDSTGASSSKRRSLTTRLLHKAKLHVHHHMTNASRKSSELPSSDGDRRKRKGSSVYELGVNTDA